MAPLKCKFCDIVVNDLDRFVHHMEIKHGDMIPNDMTGYQFVYYMRTGKSHGNCIMCKKPTRWNERTNKYHRFCDNPKCKDKYIVEFHTRMIGKYGKISLLNDPDHQRYMLEQRAISKKYTWSDGVILPYVGSYEGRFLEYLDMVLDYESDDVMSPSPHTYYYIYENKQHFYIPDLYIPSLNVEIEIKDGGSNPNTHPKIQAIDKKKEMLKDEVLRTNKNNFNYLKIIDNDFKYFFKYLEVAKQQFKDNIEHPIVMLG